MPARRNQVPVQPARPPLTPPTREVLTDKYLEFILETAASEARTTQKWLAQWNDGFAGDPARAFEWSQDAFKHAGRYKIAKEILAMVDTMRTLHDDPYAAPSSEKILRWLQVELHQEVMRSAKYPEHSTSPVSNYMAQCVAAARAEYLEKIERRIAALDRGEVW